MTHRRRVTEGVTFDPALKPFEGCLRGCSKGGGRVIGWSPQGRRGAEFGERQSRAARIIAIKKIVRYWTAPFARNWGAAKSAYLFDSYYKVQRAVCVDLRTGRRGISGRGAPHGAPDRRGHSHRPRHVVTCRTPARRPYGASDRRRQRGFRAPPRESRARGRGAPHGAPLARRFQSSRKNQGWARPYGARLSALL